MTEIVAKVVNKQEIAAQILRHIIIGRINRSGNGSCTVPVVESMSDRPAITKDGQLVYVKPVGDVIVQPDPTPVFEASTEEEIEAEINKYTNLFYNPEPQIAEERVECFAVDQDLTPIAGIIVATQAEDGIDAFVIQIPNESGYTVYIYSYQDTTLDPFELGNIDLHTGWNKVILDTSGEEPTQTIEYITYEDLPSYTGDWFLPSFQAINVAGVGAYINTEPYIQGGHTHTDTNFELETVYPEIFINPTPRKLSVLAPDWGLSGGGYGIIAVSEKLVVVTQYEVVGGEEPSPEILMVQDAVTQRIYVYLYDAWADLELTTGWYEVIDDYPYPIDYSEIPVFQNVELLSPDTPAAFERMKWILPYYISDNSFEESVTVGQLYISINGEWVAVAGGSGMTTVDCFGDLPAGSIGDLANVRKDTVDAKPTPDLQIDEQYPYIYGNPIFRLSDLGTEYFEENVKLGDNTYAQFRYYPDGEPDGSITIPYVELNQSFEMDGYVIQNLWLYIEQNYEFAIDWQAFSFNKGWVYITVKISFDDETGAITVYDKNITQALPPITALTAFEGNGVNENAKNIVFDETPFTVHNAGLYERQNSGWVLINRSNVWNPCTDDVPVPPVETFNILTENGDTIITEDGNNLRIE